MDKKEINLKIINMNDVKVEEVEWLLYPFIPFGKITILEGDPGEGKTTVMLQIIAQISKGEKILPSEEDSQTYEPMKVIYQTAEDGLGDTIKPRLLSAGADCRNVLVIDDSEKALTISDERLGEAVKQTGAKLIVLDPLQGYLGANVDMHRANEIRPLMHKLSGLAEKYKCAVVLIGHMNKSSVGKSNYRGLGSIDIHAAARSVVVCGRVKDEPEVRVLCQIKSSLAPERTPIAFRLTEERGFEWIGAYDITADELLSGDVRGSKIREATKFLEEILCDGQKSSVEIEAEAVKRGIKKKTLWNAKNSLNIDSVKVGNKWYWMLNK